MSTPRTIATLSVVAAAQLFAGGCAGTTSTAAPVSSGVAMTQPAYHPVSAAALAFDPPIALAQPLADTSRDGRSPSAFMGYEDAVTTYSASYQRDEIRGFRGDFDRQANTYRTSVTTR